MQLGGLHHLTAITGNASLNVAFYTQVLGMRLVKKTVNQDDVTAYHLFYGDDLGHAGTEVTFFDWPDAGASRHGTGTISTTMLGVRGKEALEWWVHRLDSFGVNNDGLQTRSDGKAFVAFRDPEGQRLELLDDEGKITSTPWQKSSVPAEHAIRGLYGVRLTIRDLARSEVVLVDLMGFQRSGSYRSADGKEILIYEVGPGGAGTQVHLEVRPDLPTGRSAIGGVHHVAFRTPDDSEHAEWQKRLAAAGARPTQIIDRFYFHSIYFREPNGVLFEIATDGPGFATDEDPATLGESLALPPFLEPHRAQIEAGLKPLEPINLAALA